MSANVAVSVQVAKASNNSQNLRSIMDILKGTSIVNITTRTPVKLLVNLKQEDGSKVKNDQVGRVEKVTVVSALIYNDVNTNVYEQKVNRELVKEGKEPEFKVADPKWDWKTVAAGIKEYTTKPKKAGEEGVTDQYLQYIQVGKPRSYYLLDGQPISKSEIKGMPEYKPSKGQQGGLQNQVQIRMVKLQNIQRLAVKGLKLVGNFYYE